MVVAQQCFGLSDEGIEDALYDSQAIRRFVGIDLAREAAPDATTLLKFRRRLEVHDLTGVIFQTLNAHLAQQGLQLREDTLIDATLIAAPHARTPSGEPNSSAPTTRRIRDCAWGGLGRSQQGGEGVRGFTGRGDYAKAPWSRRMALHRCWAKLAVRPT